MRTARWCALPRHAPQLPASGAQEAGLAQCATRSGPAEAIRRSAAIVDKAHQARATPASHLSTTSIRLQARSTLTSLRQRAGLRRLGAVTPGDACRSALLAQYVEAMEPKEFEAWGRAVADHAAALIVAEIPVAQLPDPGRPFARCSAARGTSRVTCISAGPTSLSSGRCGCSLCRPATPTTSRPRTTASALVCCRTRERSSAPVGSPLG